jgi:hypothetical protein
MKNSLTHNVITHGLGYLLSYNSAISTSQMPIFGSLIFPNAEKSQMRQHHVMKNTNYYVLATLHKVC